MKFTLVNISDSRSSFFDSLVTIDTDRTLSVTVLQKTHTGQCLNFQSSHSLHQKLGLVDILLLRADNLVSKPDDMLSENKHLRQCLNQCGCKNSIIFHANNFNKRRNPQTATIIRKNK